MIPAAAQAAINAGAIPHSLLEIDMPDGTTFRASDAGRATDVAPYPPFVKSWSEITYGASFFRSGVETVETSVSILDPDPDRTLTKKLRGEFGRNIYGSAARIYGAIKGLPESDRWLRFNGIALDPSYSGDFVWTFPFRLDMEELRGDAHRLAITEEDFPTAPDESKGEIIPIVMGVHDSTGTGQTGMLTCIKVATDGDPLDRTTKPHRYVVSEGRLPNVTTRWVDGASETALGDMGVDWFWTNRNGHIYTEIGFAEGSQPADDAVVTVDAYGLAQTATPTADPADTSGVVQNGTEALRLYLANFVFNRWNDGTDRADWFDPFVDAPLDKASWDTARAHGVKFGDVSGRVIPSQSVEQTMQDWFDTKQIGYGFTPEGKLRLFLYDLLVAKSGIYGKTAIRRSDMRSFAPMKTDTQLAFSRVRYSHFLVESTEEYIRSRTSADPHRTIQMEKEIKMPWSAATLSL